MEELLEVVELVCASLTLNRESGSRICPKATEDGLEAISSSTGSTASCPSRGDRLPRKLLFRARWALSPLLLTVVAVEGLGGLAGTPLVSVTGGADSSSKFKSLL